ncbi:UDP-4-amino-4,6-dideoxy-N-acetyl-beta-L-altrosamine transaminase [Campylobacter hepaticus]|uniref:UDP-4-amino-4,6-dideoxy-N-acetyl-beta-L-altrosamine transaminase n=1 Tax=Campylobacter hepaticus TaxID=1813019 RepID=A0A6A7JQV5_9BACT|nr:UDP-4-amino-4,6-dideoxy-N-acetyl-beta-L-altrosamine transaminase [Campylobacter hepaticus]AXP08244.1 UDP-4-amino-4,6-dideoxy-N-acetyl-beta-L-altrosamine transaminase [Campylobacter hepaticus]MCZ0772066.1 UDP-4-amino-4,6-dideoxy-N-acetyl-beta-L-altrosamine transaminase [Campylobacter hepaticus]MCZ0773535.1 UDP-4-amino-4,6-dideoxy-N-acetyl-beta-L-altrosamine transaminase [Campylobacter hepaticus]MCZ0774785.1 UDP-4-amino-4,6-dideoxy-N-acetyl-beta-L-altrosamine transaminase [Campylobacter hepati
MLTYSHQNIDQSDINTLIKALKEEILTGGKKVDEFEQALCEYIGVKYACVLNSATSALHLAYTALNVKDKIILTTPLSFAATANAALMAGAKIEFIDIKNDGNIDEKKLSQRLQKDSSNIKAISVVDFGGNSVEMDEIIKLAKHYNIALIDDASHALGSEYKGEKVGKKADLSIFSFHPVKPITTFEGGAVVSDNEELIAKIKLLRSHGIVKKRLWDSDMIDLGYNYRLSDVACALGMNQLKKLDQNIQKREEIARFYDKEFEKNPYFSTIKIKDYKKSSRHLYPILLFGEFYCQKEELFEILIHKGIGVQVHYKPTYEFSFYKKLLGDIRLENADNFYKAELSIPCHQEMSLKDAKFVKDSLFDAFKKLKKGYCG